MRRSRYACFSLCFLWCTLSPYAFAASDYLRERKWEDEITPGLVVGDAVHIEDTQTKHRFLALVAPAKDAKAGVILVHGLGVHPDWGLIGDLRIKLVDAGYSTLSIQMPILSAEAKAEDYASTYPEALRRLDAAIEYLRKSGYTKIALVSHSMGSRMVNAWAAQRPSPAIVAWVAIGMVGPFGDLKASRYPILDLFGERDIPAVRNFIPQRKISLQSRPGSQQISVMGSGHFFEGHEKPLLTNVTAFLDRVVARPATDVPRKPAAHPLK